MITVKSVSKKFLKGVGKKSKEFYAIKNVSFQVADGIIYGVLGQNGAGKTTLLRMLSGIMTPTEGLVTIDDSKYHSDSEKLKKNIAFLSGNTKLYENLTPHELLKIFGTIYGISNKELDKRIKQIVKLLNLSPFEHNKIANLSTGQVQRTNIARAFIHDPKYYILDEATAGLDVMSSQIIIDFIKEEKKRGKTIIYSTHYMEEAQNICDQVLFINGGIKLLEDTPQNIMNNTQTTNLRDAFLAIVGGKDEY